VLAQTIAKHCAGGSQLGASFFFYRGNEERSNAYRFFSTIAFQLTTSVPSSSSFISDALAHDFTILEHYRFQDQLRKVITNPLLYLKEPLSNPVVIVVDTLDECKDKDLLVKVIALFGQYSELNTKYHSN
jgi:hypothetical protein